MSSNQQLRKWNYFVARQHIESLLFVMCDFYITWLICGKILSVEWFPAFDDAYFEMFFPAWFTFSMCVCAVIFHVCAKCMIWFGFAMPTDPKRATKMNDCVRNSTCFRAGYVWCDDDEWGIGGDNNVSIRGGVSIDRQFYSRALAVQSSTF